MNSFDSFALLPTLKKRLASLGFTTPTPIQERIIPVLLEDYQQDVHAQAQTGTGKTLAFGIPLIQAMDASKRVVQGLVMAPTRELVLQIYESLKDVAADTGVIIEPIYGGMPIYRQIDSIKRGVHIIIGTPGRINDHLRRGSLHLDKLKVLVLDEADIMLDMGFREEIDEILNAAPDNRHIWLFSATVMSGIKQLIASHMSNVVSVQVAKVQTATPQISQYYCTIPERQKIEATARFIEAAPDFYGIIFARTKVLSTEITEELASKGLKVNCLHGDMKQTLRNHVIKGFKNHDFNILVATDVAARGIDVSDLSHVINYSIPDDDESYIHRIGRTGRAGKQGIAILLVTPSQLYRVKRLEKVTNSKILQIAIPSVEAIVNVKMGAVSDFIEQAKKEDQKSTAVDEAIKKIVDSFSAEEVRRAFEVALKEKFFQGLHEGSALREQHMSISDVPQEICMDIGQEHGINEDQVRSYLYTQCKLVPQEISKVRVLKFKTFISIADNRLKSCLEAMRTHSIAKQKVKVYLVKDDYQPGQGGRERSSKRPSRKPGNRSDNRSNSFSRDKKRRR